MSDVSRKCVKFSLNTSLFYPSGDGTVAGAGAMDPTMGYSDAARVNSTFRNVDWTRVLGNMYYEYKTFNLCLTSVTYCSSGSTAFGGTAFAHAVIVRGVGLPWLNGGYDVYSRTDTGAIDLWSGNITDNMDCKSVNTFRKPPPLSDFHIKVFRAADNTQDITGVTRPVAMVYSFEVYGVERA